MSRLKVIRDRKKNRSMTEQEVAEAHRLIDLGLKPEAVAAQFNVSVSQIGTRVMQRRRAEQREKDREVIEARKERQSITTAPSVEPRLKDLLKAPAIPSSKGQVRESNGNLKLNIRRFG